MSKNKAMISLSNRANEIIIKLKPAKVFVAVIGLDGTITELDHNTKITYSDIEDYKARKEFIEDKDTIISIVYDKD